LALRRFDLPDRRSDVVTVGGHPVEFDLKCFGSAIGTLGMQWTASGFLRLQLGTNDALRCFRLDAPGAAVVIGRTADGLATFKEQRVANARERSAGGVD